MGRAAGAARFAEGRDRDVGLGLERSGGMSRAPGAWSDLQFSNPDVSLAGAASFSNGFHVADSRHLNS
jgi:hypothetical protein